MGPKKAPGLDGFTAEILKRALLSIRNYLLRLYNGMLSSGRFPTGWKEAQVVLIPKKNASNDEFKSIRPISLISVIAKLGEKLINRRLQWFFLETEFLSNAQYGIVRGRGTADLLLQISADVRNSDDKYVIGILLDISGAFDNAWWLLILDSLRRRECPRNIHAVLCDYLKDRKVSLVYRGLRVSKSLSRGCQQGS